MDQAPAWLASGLACAALLVSVASYRRSGPRAKVEANLIPASWKHGDSEDLVLEIVCRHTGIAPIEVAEIRLVLLYQGEKVDSAPFTEQYMYEGEGLPVTLKDGSKRKWSYSLVELGKALVLPDDEPGVPYAENLRRDLRHPLVQWYLLLVSMTRKSGIYLCVELGNGQVIKKHMYRMNLILWRTIRRALEQDPPSAN